MPCLEGSCGDLEAFAERATAAVHQRSVVLTPTGSVLLSGSYSAPPESWLKGLVCVDLAKEALGSCLRWAHVMGSRKPADRCHNFCFVHIPLESQIVIPGIP